jgi:ABC-2 type transport system ATP-binding protein
VPGEPESTHLAVSVHQLSHWYGDRRALEELSFEVERATIFGLLGPNGGGKTTLFRILSTSIEPDRGSALVFGADVCRHAAKVRRRIGVVFQSPSLDRNLTVAENLMHQGHLYGLTGKALRLRIFAVLETFGVLDRAGERVSKLSGGLQRRVEVAKAMLHEPELLLLDEPATGLDPAARRDLWQHLVSLRDERGTTCLLTTHLLDEADKCDAVAILDAGKLVALGMPGELKAAVGDEVISLETSDPAAVQAKIGEAFAIEAGSVGSTVRIEVPKESGPAANMLVSIVSQLGPLITSAQVGNPTLEDVFIHFTGRRFEVSPAPSA